MLISPVKPNKISETKPTTIRLPVVMPAMSSC
jgi:hypothetical protein